MESFNVTSKICINIPQDVLGISATADREADFNQIILRVRLGNRFVNFLVTDLGETVTAQFWADYHKQYEIRLTNDSRHEAAFQALLSNHLL